MNENETVKEERTDAPAEKAAATQREIPLLRRLLPHIPLILCACALLFALALAIYFIVGPAEGYLHSDCTDTLLWAQASLDAGAVFNPDFTYAALLPFGASLWLVPLLAIFGYTMTTHVIGMVIFAVLFTLAAVLLLRRMKWSYAWCFGTAAILLMILSSSDKLREIMWNHVIYYSLGLLLYFLLLSLTFVSYEGLEDKARSLPRRLLPLAILIVFSALNATNGFQMIVLTILPVLVAIVLERLLDRETPFFSKKNLPPLAVVSALGFGAVAGTLLLKVLLGSISSNYANAYSSYSAPADWPANLDKLFMNWLTLLGMDAKNRDPLVDGDSIVNILRIGVGILLLVVPLILLAFYRRIKDRRLRILALGHAFILAFLVFGCVCGRLGAANWRLTPLLGSSVIVTVAAIREVYTARKDAILSFRLGVCVLLVLSLLSLQNARIISAMPADYGRDNTLHRLTEMLEREGLTYGYATFWQSQAITLLSDSKVKVREILVEDREIVTDQYQSQGAWYEDQEGVDEYFILLSEAEYMRIDGTDYWIEITNHCLDRYFLENGYHVFVFAENIWNSHVGPRIVDHLPNDDGYIS